ncbi:MAG: polysaccharide biosynthesis tyrosine autokinase [Candidatus Omnitrophota bacterium]|nr:polysaccharide biosynthesis tyrosine autokinase [Candidatus Omnitrophota bacterium]
MNYFEKNTHVREYLSTLWRRKWIFITFFLITVTVVTTATFMQKNVYRATATVIVDVESPDILSVKDIVKLGETNYFAYRDYIETQQEIIRSRRTTYNVIKNLRLKDKKELREAKDPIEALLKKLKVELLRDTRILKISVDDEDPVMASRIANEFAKVYADSNISLKMKMSNQAQSWLKKEVDQQERKVKESENNLQTYKEQRNIVSIENQKAVLNDIMTKLNASYLAAQTKRIQTETRYASAIDKSGNITLGNLPVGFGDNKILENLKEEYMKQEAVLVEYSKVYKSKHPKMIKLLENITYLKSGIKSEIENDYKNALQEENKFKIALDEQKKMALGLERNIINYNALNRELEMNEKMLQMVLNRMKETSITSQIQTNNVRLQDLADAPKTPIKPKKKLNIALAVIVGILGGVGLAFFRDYMDMTLRNPRDIVELLQLTILGSIPKIKIDGKKLKKKSDVDSVVDKFPDSVVSEAYRSIRTNLLFSLNFSNAAKSIVITSSVPREGKTLTAVNLAILIANGGERVLLVDADMRKPRIHTVFNDDNKIGLSQFLLGEADLDSMVKYSGIENLYLVSAGKPIHKSAELISSKNMKLFLEKACNQFSMVIFDTPPVGIITDAAILSNITTGVILVAEASRATEGLLSRSKELLQKVNAKIIGVIVNNISLTNDSYSYPHYYYSHYYNTAAKK